MMDYNSVISLFSCCIITFSNIRNDPFASKVWLIVKYYNFNLQIFNSKIQAIFKKFQGTYQKFKNSLSLHYHI